tara:strand:+ start:1433 stop:1768 length:336 start_codon:yes stop_codon:yes gene_type:complete
MMANDKDFVVNGPVVVGKDIKVTLGSITSSDIDLATGNYFADTLAANTTYTISNAGDVQSFQLEVTGASTYTITWPSSIEWAGGSAPSAPATGETDDLHLLLTMVVQATWA